MSGRLFQHLWTARTLMHLSSTAILLFYLSPHILRGTASNLTIHDQLDSIFVDLKVLSESGLIFAAPGTHVPNFAGGMPRAFLPSGLYVPVWLNLLLEPFRAFVVNQILIRLAAYFGMYYLLTRHVFRDRDATIPSALAALTFALLPFYSLFGLSIAGHPAALSALIAIRRGEAKRHDWLILGLLPLYSLFVFSGIFLLALGALVWAYDAARGTATRWRFAGALVLFAAVSLVVDFQLILGADELAVSQRVEFRMPVPSGPASLDASFLNFMYGHEHAASVHRKVVHPTIALALLALIAITAVQTYRRIPSKPKILALVLCVSIIAGIGGAWLAGFLSLESFQIVRTAYTDRQLLTVPQKYGAAAVDGVIFVCLGLYGLFAGRYRRTYYLILTLLGLSAVISIWYGYWLRTWSLIKASFPHVAYVNLSRFHYFHPTIWYVLFAIALFVLWRSVPALGKVLAVVLSAIQIFLLFGLSEARVGERSKQITYAEFFSTDLFNDIRTFIGRDTKQYRVVSLGLFPSIASFNGFRTLDGYSQQYPLIHKRRFRRIIANELAADETYRAYFDDWGSRYYVFSREIRVQAEADAFLLTRETVTRLNVTVKDLRLDVGALRALGGQYVFSAVEIQNAENIGLVLLNRFERADSPWRIHLYAATSGRRPSTKAPARGVE